MLVKLQRPRLRQDFFDYLQFHVSDVRGIVSHHLPLGEHQQCKVSDRSEWLHGDFTLVSQLLLQTGENSEFYSDAHFRTCLEVCMG